MARKSAAGKSQEDQKRQFSLLLDSTIVPTQPESDRKEIERLFLGILNAIHDCTWDRSIDAQRIERTDWFGVWRGQARSLDYIRVWVAICWFPAVLALQKLKLGGRSRVRGLKLQMRLGAHPRNRDVREPVDACERQFLKLVASDKPHAELEAAAAALEVQMTKAGVDPEQVHRYFDYLGEHLYSQFDKYMRIVTETVPKRMGRELGLLDRLLDLAIRNNGGRPLTKAEIMDLFGVTAKDATDLAHRARSRASSARRPRKRLRG